MTELELIEQVNQAIEAMLVNPSPPLAALEGSLDDLLAIAADLRALPNADFKVRLRSELQKEASMNTAPETKHGAAKTSRSKERRGREGFRTVTPYLTVADIHAEIEFITKVFNATGKIHGLGSAGGFHSEYRIGDSMVMIGGGGKGSKWKGTPAASALHVYVEDVDEVYQRAVAAGATSLMPPTNQEYGDRDAAFEDVGGNHWYIGTHKGASYIPENADNLMPYLHPVGAPAMITFLKQAFEAEEIGVYQSPDGIIHHAKMRVGNSIIEMGEAHAHWKAMPMTFMLYVEDCDAWYERAINAEGAIPVSPPSSAPYGGRVGVIKDQFENTWYISTS